MANFIRYVVLDVGQGSGNFVEIRDEGSSDLLSTVLIDLGSERAPKTTAGGPSVEYVVATLKNMAQPTINALIFSHSDSDHINLMVDVLAAFKPYGTKGVPKKDTLLIDWVWYGGDYARYEKRGKNILVTVMTYMSNIFQMRSVPFQYTNYNVKDAAKSAPLITVQGDVKVYLLIGNSANSATPHKSNKKVKLDGYAINSNSLVVTVEFADVQVVATGDATGSTLVQCNKVLTQAVIDKFFTNVFMVTMPHHGSATTTFDIKSNRGTAEANLASFAENLNAKTITASAERVRTFKHPSAVVMSYFWKHLDSTAYWWDDDFLTGKKHFYTAHFTNEDGFERDKGKTIEDWPYFTWWYTVQTPSNTYTNLYYDYDLQGGITIPPDPGPEVKWLDKKAPQPPLGVAWIYRVNSDGTKEMIRRTNRESLLRLRYAILDGVDPTELPVPPPEEFDAAEQPAVERSASPRATTEVIVAGPTDAAKSSTKNPAAPKLPGLKIIP